MANMELFSIYISIFTFVFVFLLFPLFKEVEVLTTSIDDTDPADNDIEWGS